MATETRQERGQGLDEGDTRTERENVKSKRAAEKEREGEDGK